SMTSILGFLILVGTVVNNGILYVDTVNQYRMEMDLETAMIEAGAVRLRPMLMTSLTTILGMLPMAAAMGSSGSTTQGLAIVDIGGLTAGLFVALFMLPVYYGLMNRKPRKINEDWDID
ncbi:MAG: efflux RND transporter permease subunit, partial [Clostridium sp.]